MEYRFTMTRRLLAVAAFGLVALLALLFLLGIQIGQMMVSPAASAAPAVMAPIAPATASPDRALLPALSGSSSGNSSDSGTAR